MPGIDMEEAAGAFAGLFAEGLGLGAAAEVRHVSEEELRARIDHAATLG